MSSQAQAPATNETPGTAITPMTPTAPQPRPLDPMTFLVDARQENITSQLGHGLTMHGTVRGSGGMIVRGTIEGDLIIDDDEGGKSTVVILETGVVRGIVCARRVIIHGTVDAVVARSHLVVAKTAKILGHTYYDRKACEDGCEIEGVIRRLRPGIDPIAEIMAARSRAANEHEHSAGQGGGASFHAVAANG